MQLRPDRVAGRLHRRVLRASRAVRQADRRIAARYLAGTPEPMLHLGCGAHVLDGWLNADLVPGSADVLGLDVTRPFPFPADTFAYVYSEHVIGSLSFESAAAMLRECFRVLAPGGKLRIATPDLAFLAGLYGQELSETQKRYVEWFGAETGSSGGGRGGVGFVVNGYMGAWGLQVVYDAPMLREALHAAGFAGVTRRGLNESGDEALRDLANEKRMPEGLLRLESLTLEGSKPAGRPMDGRGRRPGDGAAIAGGSGAPAVQRPGEGVGDTLSVRRRVRRRSRRLVWRAARILRRVDRRIAARYLAVVREPKLHLGCYEEVFDGWLNTDRAPRLPEVMLVDAARPFPFPNDVFVYVYSEYMLGSLAFRRVPAMLSECFRVLAPGGKLRIVTTDAAFLAGLCGPERSASQQRYMQWASDRRLTRCRHGLCREWRRRRSARAAAGPKRRPPPVAAGVFFNHHLHADTERFVYDAAVLRAMLESAGFSNVVRCELNRSEDPALCGLANEGRMPAGFLAMESLALEGAKPLRPGRRKG